MVDAFGGGRVKVKPPERGVFPLDHDGECKHFMKKYLECVSKTTGDNLPCRDMARSYLQCRMDRELMAKENLDELGFGNSKEYVRMKSNEGEKEKTGFVAGTGVRASGKSWFNWK